jgi:hypothetical protein
MNREYVRQHLGETPCSWPTRDSRIIIGPIRQVRGEFVTRE